MSRYIDAENLSKVKYHNLPYTHIVPNGENVESYERGWNDAIDAIIENEPTADVTKVICCKDCFYAKPYNAKWQLPIKEDALWCTHHEEEKTQGWFCADAIERMVEDGKIH